MNSTYFYLAKVTITFCNLQFPFAAFLVNVTEVAGSFEVQVQVEDAPYVKEP